MGRVRTAINARMEETSFRAGATVSAGVLAVTGGAIALAVTLGGSHADAASAPAPATVLHTSVPSVPAPVFPSPAPSPTSPKPKPRPRATGYQAPPEVAAVYSPPSPDPGGGYQGRHRMRHGGWPFAGSGSWGHYGHPGRHGGPHFP
jgi:hypothetical protein